jgi:hypothetical protein
VARSTSVRGASRNSGVVLRKFPRRTAAHHVLNTPCPPHFCLSLFELPWCCDPSQPRAQGTSPKSPTKDRPKYGGATSWVTSGTSAAADQRGSVSSPSNDGGAEAAAAAQAKPKPKVGGEERGVALGGDYITTYTCARLPLFSSDAHFCSPFTPLSHSTAGRLHGSRLAPGPTRTCT